MARQLAVALRSACSTAPLLAQAEAAGCASFGLLGRRTFATADGTLSRKDVAYNLDNTSDAEAEAAVKAYQVSRFQAAAKGALPTGPAEPELEFTAQVERKYKAAQIVETGIQGINVPLSYQAQGGNAALKRFAAQLQTVGSQAGFSSPDVEVSRKIQDSLSGAESLKELLVRLRPLTSPDFHAGLLEALAAAEAETGGSISLDGGSAGYKKFADKVKKLAQEHKLPWQTLVSYKTKIATADEATRDALTADYKAWLTAATLQDVKAEIEELKSEAARLLDTQLAKSSAAVKKEQEAELVAIHRKLEASKGTPWAAAFQKDLAFISWFDSQVAADPAAGPKAARA